MIMHIYSFIRTGGTSCSVLMFKLASSKWWASEVNALTKIALSQLWLIEVVLLMNLQVLFLSWASVEVWCVVELLLMVDTVAATKLLLLLIVLRLVDFNIGWLVSIELNWWSGSSWGSGNQINNWLLDDFINLLSDLDDLLLSVEISSNHIVSLYEWVEFSLEFSVLRCEELAVVVEWLKFELQIVVSVKESIVWVSDSI